MKRSSMLAVLHAIVGLGAFATNSPSHISAQNADLAGHPLVGTWILNTNVDKPSKPPTLASFGAAGIYSQVAADGAVGIGAWQATGERTAELTFHELGSEDGNYRGMVTIRAALEAAAHGQSLTATYTLEITDPDGTGPGQYGPVTVTGTKVVVEPMGTPVGSIEDLFAEEGTPEAGK
jgi:hypothetical protein